MENLTNFAAEMKADQSPDIVQLQNSVAENAVLMSDFKWCDSATSLMLKLYREKQVKFNNPHVKKKVVWREIAEIMQQNGYAFDADRCERKFLNLKTSYRNTIQHNCMTGNLSRTCAFFAELHEIFQMQLGIEDNKIPANIQPSPVRLVANSSNVQVVSIPDAKDSKSSTSSTPPSEQTANRYSARQQNVPISPQSHTSSESPFEKRSTPNSSHNNNPNHLNSFHATAAMFLEASAQRNNINRQHAQAHYTTPQPKSLENHTERRQSLSEFKSAPIYSAPSPAIPQTSHHAENGRTFQNTSVIDLCSTDRKRPSISEEDERQAKIKKRRNNDLQNLLSSFEKYREEQKIREDDRMKMMKEFHDEEIKVMNRFLDIIQHCVQNSSDD